MREQLEKRLAELQAEHQQGTAALAEMDRQRVSMQQTVLRIAGAIQLCQELLNTAPAGENGGDNGSNH